MISGTVSKLCSLAGQMLGLSNVVFSLYNLSVLHLRVQWIVQHVDFCWCKIYICRLENTVSPKLSHSCYFPRQGPKLSWKYIEPRWQIPAQRLMDTYVYTHTWLFESSTSPGLWSIWLEHHTEISMCTNTNPFIEISFEGNSLPHSHKHTHFLRIRERCLFTLWRSHLTCYRAPASVQHNTVFTEVLSNLPLCIISKNIMELWDD